jgi:hypothetical protein
MSRWMMMLSLGLLLTGCGGGGGGGGPSSSGGPWAGTWAISDPLNADSRYRNCTGVFASLEGTLVAPQPGEVICELDTITIQQSGATLTMPRRTVGCTDGSTIAASGTGTVAEPFFDFTLTWDFGGGSGYHALYDGSRSERVVAAAHYAIVAANGACDVIPDLQYQATIQQ